MKLIVANIVKSSAPNLTVPLLHIFNISLKQGVFPDKLKIARVLPVFKTGNATSVSNYRPYSILPCFSKILERIMYNRLYSFLSINNLLYEKQFGFHAGHSTDHAILQLIQEIYQAFDENKYTLGIFIDLCKAAQIEKDKASGRHCIFQEEKKSSKQSSETRKESLLQGAT